jgi:hypothetical protein
VKRPASKGEEGRAATAIAGAGLYMSTLMRGSSMPSEIESLALYLVGALYDASDGLPQQWCMLKEPKGATAAAIVFAAARGWVVVEAGQSICLTDAGRRLVESHRQ